MFGLLPVFPSKRQSGPLGLKLRVVHLLDSYLRPLHIQRKQSASLSLA